VVIGLVVRHDEARAPQRAEDGGHGIGLDTEALGVPGVRGAEQAAVGGEVLGPYQADRRDRWRRLARDRSSGRVP
jgi:hypothetical protein